MRRYIRSNTPGATYFLTLTLQDRSAQWLTDHVHVLRDALAQVKARHPFRIDAMVVLPEHLHTLWTLPTDDADFAVRCMLLKQSFTRRLCRTGQLDGRSAALRGTRAERSLWQRRYWEHQILDDNDFARHVDYIHFNPVKHGWVDAAADWPHSSFHRFVRAGLLPPDWGISAQPDGRFGE